MSVFACCFLIFLAAQGEVWRHVFLERKALSMTLGPRWSPSETIHSLFFFGTRYPPPRFFFSRRNAGLKMMTVFSTKNRRRIFRDQGCFFCQRIGQIWFERMKSIEVSSSAYPKDLSQVYILGRCYWKLNFFTLRWFVVMGWPFAPQFVLACDNTQFWYCNFRSDIKCYCWWKKSSWDVQNPLNNGIFAKINWFSRRISEESTILHATAVLLSFDQGPLTITKTLRVVTKN